MRGPLPPNARPFAYQEEIEFGAGALTVGSVRQGSIAFDAGSRFYCQEMLAELRADATGRVCLIDDNDGTGELGGLPDIPVLLSFRETGNQRAFCNEPVTGRLFCGTHRGQGRLPTEYPFEGNTTLTIEATLQKALAAASTLFVVLYGYRV